jgi:hypothetical protein
MLFHRNDIVREEYTRVNIGVISPRPCLVARDETSQNAVTFSHAISLNSYP